MHDIINNILLTGDIFTSEKHLQVPKFTERTCVPFIKNLKLNVKVYRNGGLLTYLLK